MYFTLHLQISKNKELVHFTSISLLIRHSNNNKRFDPVV